MNEVHHRRRRAARPWDQRPHRRAAPPQQQLPDITAYAEGFVWPENPEFYYRLGIGRNPRTLAGITPEGNLLLLTVDGRQPGYSVGASFEESALIMQALCAEEAVNLDCGGSTTLTTGEVLMHRLSDPTGERPVGDAVVLLP